MKTLLALILMTTAANAAPVVDAQSLKSWIDANDFEPGGPVDPPDPPEPGTVTPPPQASGYKLTFSDEFSGPLSISHSITHDGSKWYTETEPCCMPGGSPNHRVFPHVIAPTTVEQANPFSIVTTQDGGKALRMRLTKTNNVWYGAGISSTDRDNQKGFAQTYGYWEARMKLAPGLGPWQSFWALSQARTGPPGVHGMYTQKGEIDIMEIWGQAPAMWVTLHDWANGTHPYSCKAMVRYDFFTNFHTYGMKWTAAKMEFYFDNAKVCETVTPAQFKQPYWPVFDIGMGGGYDHKATPDPSDMFVDYVRIWQAPAATQMSVEEDMTRPPLEQPKQAQ